jgi:peptidoglycan/xylan/chitin deacetylase (PgdA/CDA1 family)
VTAPRACAAVLAAAAPLLAGCMSPSPPLVAGAAAARTREDFHASPVLFAARAYRGKLHRYRHLMNWEPRLLLAGAEDVQVTIRLTDRNVLPGDYRFCDSDRAEVVDPRGRTAALTGLRVFRGKLIGRIPRVPPDACGYWKLIVDQTQRGGARHEFDFAMRAVKKLRVALTFDDGPVPSGDPDDGLVNGSPTARTLDVLAAYRHGPGRSRRGLTAAFFVLTGPEKFMGKTYRKGETGDGRALMARAAREGHLVEAHWGGRYRRQRYHHTGRVDGDGNGRDDDGDGRADEDRAYDVDGDGRPDGGNALESDLTECINRIVAATGRRPEFVRPPEWVHRIRNRPELERRVKGAYRRLGLKMILTDAKLGDGGYAQVSALTLENRVLTGSLRRAVARGHSDLVITMHDSNSHTVRRLERWLLRIERILERCRPGGQRIDVEKHVEFIGEREKLRALLGRKRGFAYPRGSDSRAALGEDRRSAGPARRD